MKQKQDWTVQIQETELKVLRIIGNETRRDRIGNKKIRQTCQIVDFSEWIRELGCLEQTIANDQPRQRIIEI